MSLDFETTRPYVLSISSKIYIMFTYCKQLFRVNKNSQKYISQDSYFFVPFDQFVGQYARHLYSVITQATVMWLMLMRVTK